MRPQTAKQSVPSFQPDEVRQSLDNILNSKYFVNATKKRAFLRLICDFYLEGRAHELNEYILGYDVFDRDKTYEPSADPVVRVTAHEIRKKLEAYYQHDGIDDPFRLEIPPGSYEPIFTPHTSEKAALEPLAPPVVIPTETAPTAAAAERRLPIARLVLSLAVLALAVAVVVLSLTNRDLRRKASGADHPKDRAIYGALWAPFMESDSPP